MFLLVSGRHVGAHTDGQQRGVSIQISINFGKKIYPHISRKKNCCDQILDFIYRPVLIFILIYFELRDTENQQ